MGDLIDRREAIEAVADYIHNVDIVMGNGTLSADDCIDAAESVLEDLPSAQPELVRCEKCAIRYTSCPMVVRSGVVGVDKLYTEDDDYCSYGVAKGESDGRYDKQTGGT